MGQFKRPQVAPRFAALHDSVECWSARELQVILGYSKWNNFLHAIEKAKSACEGAGQKMKHHFADVGKMINLGKGGQRNVVDFALTLRLLPHRSEWWPHKKAGNSLCQNLGQIKKEHIDNNLAVRKILQERGVRPENLPAVEDVKKVERRLNADNKKAIEKPDAFKILPPPKE